MEESRRRDKLDDALLFLMGSLGVKVLETGPDNDRVEEHVVALGPSISWQAECIETFQEVKAGYAY